MEIETDNLPRKLLCLADLPEQSAAEFDYVEQDDFYTPRIVEVGGEYYDVFDTMTVSPSRHPTLHPFSGWDAYISESFFSGVLFRFSVNEDGEEAVTLGRYSC